MSLLHDLIVNMSSSFAFCVFTLCAMVVALYITMAVRRTALHNRNLDHEIKKIRVYGENRMIEGRSNQG